MRLSRIALATIVALLALGFDATYAQPAAGGANAGKLDTAGPIAEKPVPPDPLARAVPGPNRNESSRKLTQILDDYFDQYLALHPLRASELGEHRFDDKFGDYASPSWMADSLGIEQESLEKLATINPRKLRRDELDVYEAFGAQRELNIGGYRYPSELLAIDPFASPAEEFVLLGSGRGAHPFRTTRDYDNFLARMDGFVAWVDQAINNLRAGVTKGLVLPKPVIVRLLPQLQAIGHFEDPRETPFWQPLLNFPAGPTVAERRRLLFTYDQKLRTQVLPAYRRLHDYLAKEYMPEARITAGWSALPGGDFWYAYLVRYYTSSQMTPADATAFASGEVSRLRFEVERMKSAMGLTGTLAEAGEAMRVNAEFRPANANQVTAMYARAHARVAPRLSGLFAQPVRTDLEIRAVESYREATAPPVAYRPPSAESKRAGVLYVNTRNLTARPGFMVDAFYLEAAIPGRHYQTARMQENIALPRVLRYGQTVAYQEGWAAYAGTLGRELGLYDEDVFSQFGALALQLARAALMAVDLGLHVDDWTRERAIDYLRSHTALSADEIESDVDRCIAEPGVALAGPVGAHRILAWRRTAEQALGAQFNVREFHEQIIGSGAVPWAVLDTTITRWIATQR